MSRSSWAGLLWLVVAAAPAAGAPRLCLPPVFDGGQRLFEHPYPRVHWLELALRQHELCWRRPADPAERRVALFGNSAVYGYPLRADETLAAALNRRFAADRVAAHVFNLGWVNCYQVRDAVIIHQALAYEPDLILYPLTLADFHHVAPLQFAPVIEFFRSNRPVVEVMADDPPPGLEPPFAAYRKSLAAPRERRPAWYRLREIGVLLRLAVRGQALRVADRLAGPRPAPKSAPSAPRNYDCAKTKQLSLQFDSFQYWNILAYLEALQRERGIAVLVVNWPVLHEPIGACYSRRYTNRHVLQFNAWLGEQTRVRGLRYLDLHRLLGPADFVDTIHVNAAGQRRIADAIAPVLAKMMRATGPAAGGGEFAVDARGGGGYGAGGARR